MRHLSKMLLFSLCFFIADSEIKAQAPSGIPIFNLSQSEELRDYQKLDLDATHSNLLNPQVSESGFEEVFGAWKELHQRIGNHLREKEFDWGSEADHIAILHKVYFHPDGQISYYCFRVFNSEVSTAVQQRYGKLLSEFLAQQQIDLEKESTFAQCGKTKYPKRS